MDNFVRNSTRKPASATPKAPSSHPIAAAQTPVHRTPQSKLIHGLIAGLIILALAVAGWLYLQGRTPAPMADRYQAVFLDDGKVFFGRLQATRGDYLKLDDAYYTQSQTASSDGENQLQPTGGVNLIRVGEEVYGPENNLMIRSDQVLFWQNLTSDNQIVKAIEARKD